MFQSMKVKTPSFTIPSITVRTDVVLLLLVMILFTTCFTFQSCCKVGWREGFEGFKEGIGELKHNVTEALEHPHSGDEKEKKNQCNGKQ